MEHTLLFTVNISGVPKGEEQPGEPSFKSKGRLLLIDVNNVVAKGYHASPGRMNQEGQMINGVDIFWKSLMKLNKEIKPTHIVACADLDSSQTIRKQMYSDYKEGRQSDEDLKSQFPLVQALLEKAGVHYVGDPQFEADDFIYSYTKAFDGEVYIASSDKDLHQLLGEGVTQVFKSQKRSSIYFKAEDFKDEYGVDPKQIVAMKSIIGDSSDNIKGIKGIGQKFLEVIQALNIESIDHLYQEDTLASLKYSYERYYKKIVEGESDARQSEKLVQLYETDLEANSDRYKKDLNIEAAENYLKRIGVL